MKTVNATTLFLGTVLLFGVLLFLRALLLKESVSTSQTRFQITEQKQKQNTSIITDSALAAAPLVAVPLEIVPVEIAPLETNTLETDTLETALAFDYVLCSLCSSFRCFPLRNCLIPYFTIRRPMSVRHIS